jgi:hypothetical protein
MLHTKYTMRRLTGSAARDNLGPPGGVPAVGAGRARAGRRAVQEGGGRVLEAALRRARPLWLAHGRGRGLRLLRRVRRRRLRGEDGPRPVKDCSVSDCAVHVVHEPWVFIESVLHLISAGSIFDTYGGVPQALKISIRSHARRRPGAWVGRRRTWDRGVILAAAHAASPRREGLCACTLCRCGLFLF